ncbi:MAG: adenosylcobinamide-phosphate synthase CbiB [Verrucomicrobiota bacterium]
MQNNPGVILLVAIVLDRFLGDPAYRMHPVRLFGHLITALEHELRKRVPSLRLASFLLPALALFATLLVYILLTNFLGDWVWVLNIYLTYSLLALGDLLKHAKAVQQALNVSGIKVARQQVQRIVGRDTSVLDSAGVARATIESVAESFVDGILAPIFWFAFGVVLFGSTEGGVFCLITFKVVSTLDSMVGYKNKRYLVLGRVSARLDDLLNFVPARLSIPLIALAAKLLGNDARAALHIGLRDRKKHSSPNSAHAEAAVAGALDLRLGGPTQYPHTLVDKPWLGKGSAEASPAKIGAALRLVTLSTYLAAGIAVFIVF